MFQAIIGMVVEAEALHGTIGLNVILHQCDEVHRFTRDVLYCRFAGIPFINVFLDNVLYHNIHRNLKWHTNKKDVVQP